MLLPQKLYFWHEQKNGQETFGETLTRIVNPFYNRLTMSNVTHSLVNRDFQRSVKTLRRILPKLAFSLLIGTYLISALMMGVFHAQNAPNIGFIIAAFALPLAIQAGRGTLVFFFQLNPARIQSRYSMAIIAATLLLGLSIWEAVVILEPYGFSWMLSASTLMLIGYIIEIMILRETMFATQMELYQNKSQWQELKAFYVARNEFEAFMDALIDGEAPALPHPTDTETAKAEEAAKAALAVKAAPEDDNEEPPKEGNGSAAKLLNFEWEQLDGAEA